MKRTLIITGVGKGFGRHLLKYFSNKYFVIGLTRSEEDVAVLLDDTEIVQDSVALHTVDVSNFSKVSEVLYDYVHSSNHQIFGLINNAGVRCRRNFLEMNVSDIKQISDINLFAPINLVKILLPSMLLHEEGRIINISSILSTNALPSLSAYTISKAGLDGFTRSVAVEFASQGITCNSILPGFCETSYFESFKAKTDLYNMTLNRTPAKRWGKDDELIGLCELLLGQQGSFINGACIPIDGGWTAC